jgi:hypothetical protein
MRQEPNDGPADVSHIKCVWCSAPWSDANLQVYNLDAGDHCDSGRFYEETCSVQIKCASCKRVMYQKDGVRCGG